MNVFVLASYSSQINHGTGEVFPEYKEWLEANLTTIESLGHTVFCALREDDYKINNADPAAAFKLDLGLIKSSDAILALLTDKPSEGVATEVGAAVALEKRVVLARLPEHKLGYFNSAMLHAGVVREVALPFDITELQAALS